MAEIMRKGGRDGSSGARKKKKKFVAHNPGKVAYPNVTPSSALKKSTGYDRSPVASRSIIL